VVSKTKFRNQPEQTYQAEYPYQAVNFLKAHPEWNDLKIFNDYGWGGYLIWQDPSRELFVDGRLPEYPLRGSTVLKEYSYFFDPKKMAAQLQYYDIGLVLIGSQEKYPQINPLEQWYFYLNQNKINTDAKKSFALLDYLRTSPQWKSVYRDSLAEIFIKQAK
jgi:hypothetical protein